MGAILGTGHGGIFGWLCDGVVALGPFGPEQNRFHLPPTGDQNGIVDDPKIIREALGCSVADLIIC